MCSATCFAYALDHNEPSPSSICCGGFRNTQRVEVAFSWLYVKYVMRSTFLSTWGLSNTGIVSIQVNLIAFQAWLRYAPSVLVSRLGRDALYILASKLSTRTGCERRGHPNTTSLIARSQPTRSVSWLPNPPCHATPLHQRLLAHIIVSLHEFTPGPLANAKPIVAERLRLEARVDPQNVLPETRQ